MTSIDTAPPGEITDTAESADAPAFTLPEQGIPAAEQLVAVQSERDRWVDWLTVEARTGGDITAILALTRSVNAQHRKLAAMGLGPEGVLAAQEVARRAERAVHQAIDHARESGKLIKKGHNPHGNFAQRGKFLSDFGLSHSSLGNTGGLYRITGTDEVIPEEIFDKALTRCAVRGSMARPAVLVELAELTAETVPHDNVDRLRRLAEQGSNSRQIARELDWSARHVRRIARHHGIAIPGDLTASRTSRSIDPERSISSITELLDGITTSLGQLEPADYAHIPDETKARWLVSLRPATKALTALTKELTR